MPNDIEVHISSGKIINTMPARIQISMFNPCCTGKYLFALTKWLKNNGITEVEFQISDTLQRHNFLWRKQVGLEKATKLSLFAGDQWIDQNIPTAQFCGKTFNKFNTNRWNFWLQQKDFIKKRNFFYQLSEDDLGFQAAIDEEIELYFKKLGRSLNPSRRKHSKDFLIEEIAVSEISAQYFPANEIYPGPRFIPDQYLLEHDISKYKIHIKDMNFIHVEFKDNGKADHHFSNRMHGSEQNTSI